MTMGLFSKLFIVSRALSSPLEILFTLLVFILSKNLGLTAFQLTLITCSKPISSFFAFYVSSVIFDNPHRIRLYLVINTIIGSLPCFFYPFVDNTWFYIASYFIFMITMRATSPAWIEVLKSNTEGSDLSKTIAFGNSITYIVTIVFAPIVCYFMDLDVNVWRYIFLGFALVKLMNIFLVFYINSELKIQIVKPFLDPLKNGWGLLKDNRAFAHYLALYFLGGVAIVGSQAMLPIYFKETLNLSYSQLGIAFSFCKGASFVLTSPYWLKLSNRLSLYHLNAIANLFSCLYFVCTMAASGDITWLYVAYLFYGTMLSGCELSANLCGPFFSGSKDSTIYSSLILAISGIRGSICPLLGGLLFANTGATTVFITCTSISFMGIIYGHWASRRYEIPYSQHIEIIKAT